MNYIPIEHLTAGRIMGPKGIALQFPSTSWEKAVRDYSQYFAVAAADGEKTLGVDRYLNQRQFAIACNVFDINRFPVGVYLRSLTDRSHSEEMATSPFFFAPWFDPGRLLFLVEGYLDMLAVAKIWPATVAIGSNSLTLEQTKWLAMMHKSGVFEVAVFLYDNDERREDGRRPGLDGAQRGKRYLEQAGIMSLKLPTPFNRKDPGELYGHAEFEAWVVKIADSLWGHA